MSDTRRTILIVDDEPQILRLVEKMIGPHRANVMLTPRPTEALRICETQTVDVLISDMQMPEMDGMKLAERVLKHRPETAVLLISGKYQAPPAARSGRVKFLKKPFFPSELIAMLEGMLSGSPPRRRDAEENPTSS